MPFYFYNFSYMIYLLPGILLALYAQAKVSSAFNRYSQVANSRRLTGAQAARFILDRNGLQNVQIERVRGNLTDHYDPRSEVLRLSESVYDKATIAAVSVAAHEVGHALQDAENYSPLRLRTFLVPAAQLGSSLSFYMVLFGLIFGSGSSFSQLIINTGIALFCIAVLFQLVTLPVEFNASRRAELQLAEGLLPPDELKGTRAVLNAAALTYVASLITAFGTLFRLIAISQNRD